MRLVGIDRDVVGEDARGNMMPKSIRPVPFSFPDFIGIALGAQTADQSVVVGRRRARHDVVPLPGKRVPISGCRTRAREVGTQIMLLQPERFAKFEGVHLRHRRKSLPERLKCHSFLTPLPGLDFHRYICPV